MTFSEKLYALRRKSGLSQERLAEQLGVSRQAISKWESGQSMPESDKLIALSDYFGVSLDCLLRGTDESPFPSPPSKTASPEKPTAQGRRLIGLIFSIGGILGLVIWGLLSITAPDASNLLSESSAIHIDGNGIFLLLCLAAVLLGGILLFKSAGKH